MKKQNKKGFRKFVALFLTVLMVLSTVPMTNLASFISEAISVESPLDFYAKENETRVDMNFNKNWKFRLGAGDSYTNYNSNWDDIDLPHDFSITQAYTNNANTHTEYESGLLPGGTGWYQKLFTLPTALEGKRIILNFDGAYKDTTVYVNGTKIGENHYGYNPFSFDITDNIKLADNETDNANLIAVKVENQLPSSRWYSGSGLNRDVTLTVVDPVHVSLYGTAVTGNMDGTTTAKITLQNDNQTGNASVTVKAQVLSLDGKETGSEVSITESLSAGTSKTVTLNPTAPAGFKTWDIYDGNLYILRTTLEVDGNTVDTYDTKFGYRDISLQSGTGFWINGKNVKLQGVCIHQDSGALGTIQTRDAIYRQVSILKDMGVNAIRTSHNISSSVYLDVCAELGVLVMDEFFDGWYQAKNGNSNDFSVYFDKTLGATNNPCNFIDGNGSTTWAEFCTTQAVKRDRNNPAVIIWDIGNELQGEERADTGWAQRLVKCITDNDTEGSNRKTTYGNNQSTPQSIDSVLTLLGSNYYPNNWINSHTSGKPFVSTESTSAVSTRGYYKGMDTKDASHVSLSDRQVSAYDASRVGWGNTASEALWYTLDNDWFSGEFVWTGFDYIGEPTPWNGSSGENSDLSNPNSSFFGICDTAGFAKDTYYLYRSIWNKDSNTLHLVPGTWDSSKLKTNINGLYPGYVPVNVYSNADKIALFLNGNEIATATATVNNKGQYNEYRTWATSVTDSSVCKNSGDYLLTTRSHDLYAQFSVKYEEGTLEVKAYDRDNNPITETVGTKKISSDTDYDSPYIDAKVWGDTSTLAADGDSYAYIEYTALSENGGEFLNDCNEKIKVSLDGSTADCEIAGVDNGDPTTRDKFQQATVVSADRQSAEINLFNGKALVIVKINNSDKSGVVRLNQDKNASSSLTISGATFKVKADRDKNEFEEVCPQNLVAESDSESLKNDVQAEYENINTSAEKDIEYVETDEGKETSYKYKKVTAKTSGAPIEDGIYVIYNPTRNSVMKTTDLTSNQTVNGSTAVSVSGSYLRFNSDFANDCAIEFKNVSGNQYTAKVIGGSHPNQYLYIYDENNSKGDKYIRFSSQTQNVSVVVSGDCISVQKPNSNSRINFNSDTKVAGYNSGNSTLDSNDKLYLFKKTECSYLTYNKCIPDANKISRPIEDGTYVIYLPVAKAATTQYNPQVVGSEQRIDGSKYLVLGDKDFTLGDNNSTVKCLTDNEYYFEYDDSVDKYSVRNVKSGKYLYIEKNDCVKFTDVKHYVDVAAVQGDSYNRVTISTTESTDYPGNVTYFDFYSALGDWFGSWFESNAGQRDQPNDNEKFTLYRKPLKEVEKETAKDKSYTKLDINGATNNIVSGKKYIICWNDNPVAVSNTLGVEAVSFDSNNKLISSDKNEFVITNVDNKFTIKSSDGKYLSITDDGVSLSDSEVKLYISPGDNNVAINNNSKALSCDNGELSVKPFSPLTMVMGPTADILFTLYTDGEVIMTPEEVAREALYEKIGVALNYSKGNHSESAFNAMLNAANDGINVYNNKYATQSALEEATAAIEAAIQAFLSSTAASTGGGVVRTDKQTLVVDFGLPVKYNITDNTESLINDNFNTHKNNDNIQPTTVKTYEAASAPAAGSAFNTQNISMPRASVAHSTSDKASFTGSLEDLSKCLVVYDGSSSIHFKSATNLYVYLDANMAVSTTSNNNTNNVKHFYDRSNGNYAISNAADGRCLYFYTDALRFGAGNISAGSAGSGYNNFLLFRPAKLSDGDTSSNLIPGYVQVTGNVPAGEYLIVHTGNTTNDYPAKQLKQNNQNYYVLYPSNASTFENVGKICIDTDTIVNVPFTNIKDGDYALKYNNEYLTATDKGAVYSDVKSTWHFQKYNSDITDNRYYVTTVYNGSPMYLSCASSGNYAVLTSKATLTRVKVENATIKLYNEADNVFVGISTGTTPHPAQAAAAGTPTAFTAEAKSYYTNTVYEVLRAQEEHDYTITGGPLYGNDKLENGKTYILLGSSSSTVTDHNEFVYDTGNRTDKANGLHTSNINNFSTSVTINSNHTGTVKAAAENGVWRWNGSAATGTLQNVKSGLYINVGAQGVNENIATLASSGTTLNTNKYSNSNGDTGRMAFQIGTSGRYLGHPSGDKLYNNANSNPTAAFKVYKVEVSNTYPVDIHHYVDCVFSGGKYSLSSGNKYLTGFDSELSLNSDITAWDFTKNDDGTYYISTSLNGVDKYLNISGGSVSWSGSPVELAVTYNPDNGTVVIGSGTNCVKVSGKNVIIGENGTAFTLGYVNESTATDKPVFPGDVKFAAKDCLGVIKGGDEAKLPTSENAGSYTFSGTEFDNDVCTVKGKYGTFTVNKDGLTVYTPDTMQFTGEDTFYVVSSVKNDPNFINGTYMSVEKITYVPATTVYFEDNFEEGNAGGIEYINSKQSVDGGIGVWTVDCDGTDAIVAQAADLAGSDNKNAYGYDPGYEAFAAYSNGSSHKVIVSQATNPSAAGQTSPKAQFTFAGTGFDVISLTSNNSGTFTVKVYKGTDTEGKLVKSKVVNTYYGYIYSKVFYNEKTKKLTTDEKCTPLYKTDVTQKDVNEMESPVKDDYLVTSTGKVYTFKDSGLGEAYGWIVDQDADSTLYQIPVMKITELPYDTYTVVVEARYMNMGAAGGVAAARTYELYLDAVRIYEPTGPANSGASAGNIVASEAYIADREAYLNTTEVKSLLVGADTIGAGAHKGVVFIDGGQEINEENLDDYKNVGPNNELYLNGGQAVAFEIWATAVPTDIQIGAKLAGNIKGATGAKLKVVYSGLTDKSSSFEKNIISAADMYYSFDEILKKNTDEESDNKITWTPVKSNGKTYYRSGAIEIMNSGDSTGSILSLTNIKWTFAQYGVDVKYEIPEENNDKALPVPEPTKAMLKSVNEAFDAAEPEDETGEPVLMAMVSSEVMERALALMNSLKANLEIDEKSLSVSNNEIKLGENTVITFTTSPDVDSIKITDENGKKFTVDSIKSVTTDVDGKEVKQWTVSVTARGAGEYIYNVKGVYEYAFASSEKSVKFTVNVEKPEVTEPTEPQVDPTEPGEEEKNNFFAKLQSVFKTIIDFIKNLFSLLGIKIK